MPENSPDKPKKILIIDDQPFMIKLIQYNLKKKGYDTIPEIDGLKALQNIEEIAPDMVILDIRMPKITGTELCKKFREKEITKDIPIIILTGQLQEDAERLALESGATDFMTKPFSPIELNLKIDQYLGD